MTMPGEAQFGYDPEEVIARMESDIGRAAGRIAVLESALARSQREIVAAHQEIARLTALVPRVDEDDGKREPATNDG